MPSRIEKIIFLFFLTDLGSKQSAETGFHGPRLDNQTTGSRIEIWRI
jgi:hypothetical protein